VHRAQSTASRERQSCLFVILDITGRKSRITLLLLNNVAYRSYYSITAGKLTDWLHWFSPSSGSDSTAARIAMSQDPSASPAAAAGDSMGGSYERVSLELLFLLISCFAVWKIVLFFNPRGGGRVIMSFYGLICVTSVTRLLCIFIEAGFLKGPPRVMATHADMWYSVCIDEAGQVVGSIMIYAIFILLVSFWSHMATKVTDREIADSSPLIRRPTSTTRRGPLEKFFLVMVLFVLVEGVNFVLFLLGFYNSAILILYDSIVFAVMSLLLLFEIIYFSSKVTKILKTMAAINANSSNFQIKRIRAITVVNSTYLLMRAAAEIFFIYIFYQNWTGIHFDFFLSACSSILFCLLIFPRLLVSEISECVSQ
jgi:hypothetical protein